MNGNNAQVLISTTLFERHCENDQALAIHAAAECLRAAGHGVRFIVNREDTPPPMWDGRATASEMVERHGWPGVVDLQRTLTIIGEQEHELRASLTQVVDVLQEDTGAALFVVVLPTESEIAWRLFRWAALQRLGGRAAAVRIVHVDENTDLSKHSLATKVELAASRASADLAHVSS